MSISTSKYTDTLLKSAKTWFQDLPGVERQRITKERFRQFVVSVLRRKHRA